MVPRNVGIVARASPITPLRLPNAPETVQHLPCGPALFPCPMPAQSRLGVGRSSLFLSHCSSHCPHGCCGASSPKKEGRTREHPYGGTGIPGQEMQGARREGRVSGSHPVLSKKNSPFPVGSGTERSVDFVSVRMATIAIHPVFNQSVANVCSIFISSTVYYCYPRTREHIQLSQPYTESPASHYLGIRSKSRHLTRSPSFLSAFFF